MGTAIVHSDEPTKRDRLNRTQYAEALARVAESCDTPFVIGLYGGWGVGKTTLMRLIEVELIKEKVRTVWFDPWRHQFDEQPALALLHTLVDTFQLEEEGKKILVTIAAAFGSMLLKVSTSLSLKDIDALGKRFEQEQFRVREARVRLQRHFAKIISKIQGPEQKRIVFFIDDLDRCLPAHAVSVLEALKLYLNLPGCVYCLGLDRHVLERSINQHYKDIDLSELKYLDKIIQLPFTIPPIAPDSMEDFVESLLSEDLRGSKDLLVAGLGRNPREVKRFINTLGLNHQLARQLKISDYDPKILALVLLVQDRSPGLFGVIARQPSILAKLKKEEEDTRTIREDFLARDERLREAILRVDIHEETELDPYIYLTEVADVRSEEEGRETGRDVNLETVIRLHGLWLESEGTDGERANLQGLDLSEASLVGVNLSRAFLNGAILQKATLSDSMLHEIQLNGACLVEADLRNADLEKSYLTEADLRRCRMEGANLSGTRMIGANLRRCSLAGALFRETDVRGADLQAADMRGAVGLTEDQLASTLTSAGTILPDGSMGPFRRGSRAHLPQRRGG